MNDIDRMLIFWGILVVAFGALEAVTIQLVSIWFMLGAVASLISACFTHSVYIQGVIFIGVSLLSLCLTRPIVKKYLNGKAIPTNANRNIGREGIVTETINNIQNKGQIKVNGQIWSAKSASNSIIEKDTVVFVENIEGVKAIVNTNNKQERGNK